MFEILKTIILGIVQGITEWLPVSSTGHMILVNEFIQLDVTPAFWKLFSVVIQFGSIMAVLLLYFHRLNPFSPKKDAAAKKDTWQLWFKVCAAVLPAAVIGLMFDDYIDSVLSGYVTVSIMLIVYGVLFILIENSRKGKPTAINSVADLTYKQALVIGVFQMLALIPGTSRSGATIVGSLLIGCSRTFASEFSFFLAIPTMAGASGLRLLKYVLESGLSFTGMELAILAVGMITAFVVSVIAIRGLMAFVKKHDFKAFGYYRIVLGVLVLLYFLLIK
ncbi:MAG: undecaprenyl-diphosphate phosphatase [Oscillospiraceae bacterium]|nr:undecaprenyl-diphosphate phosphatase [Oscillospiraceae bacterium]